MDDYQTGKKYKTQNGFIADIRYLTNGYLCGHVITDCTSSGFCMMHWDLDGFVLGADKGFDLIHPKNEKHYD